MERTTEIMLKLGRFLAQMEIELENNSHKGSIKDWNSIENILVELEYHKAKVLIAIRRKNYPALKEYIADCANILLVLGDKYGLYDSFPKNDKVAHELEKDLIRRVSLKSEKSSS